MLEDQLVMRQADLQEEYKLREEQLKLKEEELLEGKRQLERMKVQLTAAMKKNAEAQARAEDEAHKKVGYEPPDNNALDWLKSIEHETTLAVARLSAESRACRKQDKTKQHIEWMHDTSELLQMWLQTGEMFRESILRRRNAAGSATQHNQSDTCAAIVSGPSQNYPHTSNKDSSTPQQALNSARKLHFETPSARTSSAETDANEATLEERCKHVAALLRQRNAHTSLLIRTLELQQMQNRSAARDGMSLLFGELQRELQSISVERSELEETMNTISQVAEAWKQERTHLRWCIYT